MKKFTINQFRAMYPNDDACLDKIFQLRFRNLVCPKCENDKPFTRVKDRRSYQCPSCGFQVYPTKDTVFEKTTTPLTYWFQVIYMQCTTRNGVSAKEIERTLCVCYKTALRMAHQVKKLMAPKIKGQLYGTLELDELFIGPKPNSMRNKKRAEYKKILFKSAIDYKTTIFGILQRDGAVYTKIVPSPSKEHIEPIIRQMIDPKSKVCTDSSNLYSNLEKDFIHDTVNHSESEWAREDWHVQNIESFWNQVRRTIRGTHISVSLTHMQKYLDEIGFRWEHRHEQDTMFESILQRAV